MNRYDLGWAVAAGLLLAWISTGRAFDAADARADEAEDSIAALEPEVVRLTAEVEFLAPLAMRTDTVLVTVRDTVHVEVARAREVARAAADSLRPTLDSVQAGHLAALEEGHGGEVAALGRLLVATEASRVAWRTFGLAADSLAGVRGVQLTQSQIVNGALRSRMRRDEVKNRATQIVAVIGAGKVCYDAVNGGQTGLAIGSCAVTAWAAVRP